MLDKLLNKLFELKKKNKFPKILTSLIPKFIKKKINKRFFNYYFIPTNYSKLLKNNYNIKNSYDVQKKLINNFKYNFKQNSFMTYPHLMELLYEKFNDDEKIMFLDIGADNVDFYLELNSKFKNIEYFFCNLKPVNDIFKKLKYENNYQNFFIVDQIDDVLNKNFDFVNFGSSIEYFHDYEIILEKISNIGKNIFFSGTTLFETKNEKYKKHLIVKQVNVYPENYLYFFNREYFFSIFQKNNFKLLFEKKNFTDEVDYNNFNRIFDNINYMDFLFTKK